MVVAGDGYGEGSERERRNLERERVRGKKQVTQTHLFSFLPICLLVDWCECWKHGSKSKAENGGNP